MDTQRIEKLLAGLRGGALSDVEFLAAIEILFDVAAGNHSAQQSVSHRDGDVARLDDAEVDVDRQRRCGFPEVIYAEGKSAETVAAIAAALVERRQPVLATRVDGDQAAVLIDRFPEGRYSAVGRTFRLERPTDVRDDDAGGGRVAVVTAGTTDLPVAEEAAETLRWMGAEVEVFTDIGVAGPQRLLGHVEALRTMDAVVVVAGMEGALPSVVGGHVPCPVIGVPTSVGYGAAFGGLAALLSMLNSCAANVTVVNIDAGFKGGYVAGMIARNAARSRAGGETA